MEEYRKKAEFVESLKAVLKKADIVSDVEYRRFKDKYSEFVKVSFAKNCYTYINVTGDSLLAIYIEISRAVNKQPAVGEICDQRHIKLIDAWWTDE